MLSQYNFGQFVKQTVIINSVDTEKGTCVLSDKDDSMGGIISKSVLMEAKASEGCPVAIEGMVTVGKDLDDKVIHIAKLSVPEHVNLAVLKPSISPEEKEKYVVEINTLISSLESKYPKWYNVVKKCITPKLLDKLATLPATTLEEGNYMGGALVAMANISYMASQSMAQYMKHRSTAIYNSGAVAYGANYGMMIAASLCRFIAIPETLQEDGRKTTAGIVACLDTMTNRKLQVYVGDGSSFELSPLETQAFYNAVSCSINVKQDIRTVTKEAALLRSVVFLYRELDTIDRELSMIKPISEGNPVAYSENLNRYLLVNGWDMAE